MQLNYSNGNKSAGHGKSRCFVQTCAKANRGPVEHRGKQVSVDKPKGRDQEKVVIKDGEKPNGGAPILINEFKFQAWKETATIMELRYELGKESKPIEN